MDILNKLQDSISKLNNEQKTYAILLKQDLYLLLNARQELWHEKNPLMNVLITTYYGVIVEIDNTIDSDFKSLTKKEYDEWKERKLNNGFMDKKSR